MANTNLSNNDYRILAITACPTGIAHTYMSAEVLEKKATELGVTIKVETNGAMGIKNVLTKEEILTCDGIIVAADQDIDMERFLGRPVIRTTTADAIQHAEELIQHVIDKKTTIYDGSDSSTQTFSQQVLNLFGLKK